MRQLTQGAVRAIRWGHTQIDIHKPDCRPVMVYRQPPDVRVTWQLCQVELPVTGTQPNLYDLLLLELCNIFPAVAKLEKDLFSVLVELRCR